MTIAFIGHRKIEQNAILVAKVHELIDCFIQNGADTFLFGSRSEFNDLCYKAVTKLKEKHKTIRRVYVRGEYEFIGKDYREYLLSMYEDTFFPSAVHNAGVLSYIKRNEVMIDMCDILVVYYNEELSCSTKSGTLHAVLYARKEGKSIYNVFQHMVK